jgi:cyanobactin maturation PatA/PatG family protease
MADDVEWKQVVPSGPVPHSTMEAIEDRIGAASIAPRITTPPGQSGDAQPPSRVHAALPEYVVPSDCGCGCGGKEKAGAASGDCGCGCGGAKKKPQLVYALGTLGLDFGTEARRDSLLQAMSMMPGEANTADEARLRLLDYLDASPFDAPSVIWTLNLDATPIYAIQPVGAFAADAYQRLREALRAQIAEGVELISVPGVIAGSQRLQSGQVVPIVVPAMRGIYSWATKPLVEHVLGAVPQAEAEAANYQRVAAGVTNYLDRVYYDLRNLGVTGEERALNYSATNAVQIASVIRASTLDALDLDRIAVRKSPVCRPDSDCYDVELSFFNPGNTNTANRVFRFTVDVSDIIPVTIGRERSWTRRA